MEDYIYQNALISKKQLKNLLSWCFTKYGSVKACFLADELKYLGFKYATKAGISISIEDLQVPEVKNYILNNANREILNTENFYLEGKITQVERYQKIIDTWNITSESLKNEVVNYFKNYDPLNSVFMMAFSGARGNLSQVRQLVGMRGLMSDPSGQIMNLPIRKNFREGLSITDYLMSSYGARKGIVDTALKTANSGYLTRRLIDVAQDIIIREKDCLTEHSFLFSFNSRNRNSDNSSNKIIGRILSRPVYNPITKKLLGEINTQITLKLLNTFIRNRVKNLYIRSPLTCQLYRSICQTCYGWDLATENLIDMGEAVGIIAGQSIGEPGTQLTMRTFHTGGIFTSKANQQIISSIDGVIKFSKLLKTSILRTNRGENVLLTENSSSLSIVSEIKSENLVQIDLPRNTILFISNNQFVKKEAIIGQLAENVKQIRTETKQVISDNSGEIFMPGIKSEYELSTRNKLLWILSGKVYQAPMNSFLNFHYDSKINKNSFIFRSKVINQQSGLVYQLSEDFKNHQNNMEIRRTIFLLNKSKIQKLIFSRSNRDFLLSINKLNFIVKLDFSESKFHIQKSVNNNFGKLVSKSFTTLTGGYAFYNYKIQQRKSACYVYNIQKIYIRTLIWLPEETYKITYDTKILGIKNKSFVNSNTQILPNLLSKTSGIFCIKEKKNNIREIIIKSGYLHVIENLNVVKNLENKIFFPGEFILGEIEVNQISLCHINKNNLCLQLLVRPIDIYEVPFLHLHNKINKKNYKSNKPINIRNSIKYPYNSGEKIKIPEQVEILNHFLNFQIENYSTKNNRLELEILKNHRKSHLNLYISEKCSLNQYIPADLKYKKIQSCFIIKKNQFVDSYTTLGFLENLTSYSLEIVKWKYKNEKNKQLFLISNEDCITIKKDKIKHHLIRDLIFDTINLNKLGKILIDNNQFLTIQKGRPYFFPNCQKTGPISKNDLKYKIVSHNSALKDFSNQKDLNLNYCDLTNKLYNFIPLANYYEKLDFPKMLIKKRGKYYSSGVPVLVRELLIIKNDKKKSKLSDIEKIPWYGYLDYKDKTYKTKRRDFLTYLDRIRLENVFLMFVKSSETVKNNIKTNLNHNSNLELAILGLLEHPFKNIGIHSITEDFFEKDINSVFCRNGEFIESGQTIGLLNFEKEITGDIVQGLPRIEELLEARKKKRISKYTPKNYKKSLLIRQTTIDPSFEFRQLGTTVKENEKINPHNLLKIYFNYFAKNKYLVKDNYKRMKLTKLANNYEASYKSFKKVQFLILNSVQSVYQSQGVTIANKHLEVIIKQMTTKVLITHEGDTPLLPREVIDLYHINYINQIVYDQDKFTACYVPLLLGITKAALNNPSFISAASFQETTKVLTKAAIEGRLDWLRGLKENIIIGHLIPSGTGYKNYLNSFKKNLNVYVPSSSNILDVKVF